MNLFAEDTNFISVDYTFLDNAYDFPKYYDKITSMGNIIGIDTETTGLDYHSDRVIMVQISNGYDTYVIDVRNIELKKHKPIKDYLENESVLKIAQNATFDYSMLKMSSGIELNNLYCTKVAEQVISAGKDPAEKFNLAAIVKKRLGFTLEKEIRTSFLNTYNLPFSDSQILYGARDAYILPEVYNQQQIDIEKYGLQEVIELEMKCIAPLSDMTLHGCLIDKDKWRLIIKYAGIFQEKVDKQLRKDFSDVATQQTLFGEVPINLKSQPQLLSYLRKLGVPLETTSVKELKDYENTYEAVAHLLEYRRYEKIRSSYGEELLSKIKTSTGRLHPEYNQTAAKTGRSSSSNPNSQQFPRGKEFVDKLIPADLKNEEVYSLLKSSDYVLPEKSLEDKDAKDNEKYSLVGTLSSGEVLYVDRQEGLYYYIPDFRECFKPSPGYKIVQLDFPQAEMRIMAALSGDRVMLDAFANNQDVYKRTAAEALKIPYEKVDKKQRTNFKSVLLGLGYGLSPFGLARNLKISKDEAEDIFNRFHHAFPVLSAWLEKTGVESFKRGYADTVLGRRRWLPFLIDPNKQQDEAETLMHALIREGKNMPMQGCLNGNCNIFVNGVGYRNISSFVGDNVEVWDGSKFSKASVLYSGKKQLVKVTLWGGYYIECSPNHKFLATKRNGKSFWVEAQNLTSGDYVSINNKIPEWKYDVDSEFIPRFEMNSGNSKCTSIFDINNDFQRGEWLGRVASDGSVLKEGIRLFVAEHEEAILPYIKKITSEMGYISESFDIKEGYSQKVHRLQVNSRELSRYLDKHGIKSRIPDFVWSSSDMLKGYLRGMFDGDGTVSPSRCKGGSTISLCFGKGRSFHINWAREIQQALSLFGIRSRVRPNRGRIDVCIVRRDVPEFCDKIGFINPEKQNKALKIGAGTRQKYSKIYGNSSRVKEIEITNEFVDMYDVVNSESGMFMSNGIVTHNSNADLTKKCLVYIYNEIKKRKLPAHLMLVVHDEFVGEVLEEYAKEVALVFEECADRAFAELFPQVPTHCEALIGDYWVK